MHTACLETACASVQWPPPEGPQLNKFEQVFSDHHQMSLAWEGSQGLKSGGGGTPSDLSGGGPQVWCPGGEPYLTFVGGTLPCDLSHDVFDAAYSPTCPHRWSSDYLPICGW